MRIGIDARLINETGVGRYIRNLMSELSKIENPHQFIIFLRKDSYQSFVLPNVKWEKRIAEVRWHTLAEQIIMPFIFLRERLDVLHVPYFNAPIFYPKPFILTIHDLTLLAWDTGKATTLPRCLYRLKRIGYHIVLRLGLVRAKKIITVSETVKNDIVSNLKISPEKISVTYEGIDEKLLTVHPASAEQQSTVKHPYFLCVGNAYPHKNLEFLILAFGEFLKNPLAKKYELCLVGRDDFFYKRLQQWIGKLPYGSKIRFLGYMPDDKLAFLYQNAQAFVFPSLAEGFGLPALEALSCGCPVVCSDIPVFHEILGKNALFFDPKSISSLVDALNLITKKFHGRDPIQFPQYSWEILAQKTLGLYENPV